MSLKTGRAAAERLKTVIALDRAKNDPLKDGAYITDSMLSVLKERFINSIADMAELDVTETEIEINSLNYPDRGNLIEIEFHAPVIKILKLK